MSITLDRSYIPLTDAGLTEDFISLFTRELIEIDLGGNELTDAACPTLAQCIRRCPNLVSIDLRDNKLRHSLNVLISEIQTLKKLQEFRMDYNQIGEAGAAACAHLLRYTKSLERLELTDNSLTPIAVEVLCKGIQQNSTLTRLSLAYNGIGDAGVIALAACQFSRIKSLDISDTHMGDESCEKLSQWLRSKKCTLQLLNVSVNRITLDGARALAGGIAANQTLTKFDIGCNPIENEGATAIIEALRHHRSLTDLGFATCELDDGIVPTLNKLLTSSTKICKLELDVNNISPHHVQSMLSLVKQNVKAPQIKRRMCTLFNVVIGVQVLLVVVLIAYFGFVKRLARE